MESKKKTKDDAEISLQMKTAIGIGVVFIVVGLPVWWKTTTTYRASLPHAEIRTLASHKIFIEIPVRLLPCHKEGEADGQELSKKLQESLMKGKIPGRSFTINYRVQTEKCNDKQRLAIDSNLPIQDLEAEFALSYSRPNLDLQVVLLPMPKEIPTHSTYIGKSNTAFVYISDLQRNIEKLSEVVKNMIVNEESLIKSYATARGYTIKQVDREIMRAMRSTPGYELSFSLLNPDPGSLLATWDIEAAVEDYLQPFLNKLSGFAEFSVGSQVLYYTSLAAKPKQSKETGYYYLSAKQLPLVINPVEAKLGSHVSTNPTINFLVYVPPASQSPLFIHNEKGEKSDTNAFFSPRWGGLLVQNPTNLDENSTEVLVDMKSGMEIFLSQLRMLIGVPTHVIPGDVSVAPADQTAITDWEMAILLRKRTLENIGTSSATLFSLSKLVEQIPNMVINDDVADEVYQAVKHLQDCHEYLRTGEINKAFIVSKRAIASSEQAFFDPSLLELLYFPEDQKFAIYIPLFLPIGIPIASSLFKALKWLKTRRKAKED